MNGVGAQHGVDGVFSIVFSLTETGRLWPAVGELSAWGLCLSAKCHEVTTVGDRCFDLLPLGPVDTEQSVLAGL